MENERTGAGLALSGGGYRAMLFQAGVVWRLNELGWLPKLTVVSGVDGGSITTGVLAHAWKRLRFDTAGVAENLYDEVITPIRKLACKNINTAAIRGAMLIPWRSTGDELVRLYVKYLFGNFLLSDMPEEGPQFVITVTDLRDGDLVWFQRQVGEFGQVSLATAVAAASAPPPWLSPVVIPDPRDRTHRMVLGGVSTYDKLGLDPIEARCATVLVSDATQSAKPIGALRRGVVPQLLRMLWPPEQRGAPETVIRTGELLKSYVDKNFGGTYWGMYSDLSYFELPDMLPAPNVQTRALAGVPTRLTRMSESLQDRLINFGYAASDVSMRRWVISAVDAPKSFPYPASGV